MVLKNSSVFAAVIVLLSSLSTGSQLSAGILDPVVRGNEISARLVLLGGIEAELLVAFEQVEGLSLASLGLSVELLLPLDPKLKARLPKDVSSLTAFPLKLVIDPPATGGLSFRGLPTVSLHTDLLPYAPDTSFRLFAAAPGESFRDVTASTSSGSLRAGGREPKFAGEYVILSDLRLADEVALDKLVWLEGVLAANESVIDVPVFEGLSAQLAAVRTSIGQANPAQALTQLDGFTTTVEEESGSGIPDLWQAQGGPVNVAGALQAIAATLRYSLQSMG